MSSNDSHSPLVLLWVTAPDARSAEDLARLVVEGGLAACVNMLPGMRACYVWQGEMCIDEEVVLVVKTSAERRADCRQALVAAHPAELPCVVEIPVCGGHAPFLAWVSEQCRPASPT